MGELREELSFLRGRLSGVDDLGSQSEDTSSKVREIENDIEEIQEKLWELDKSWQNNLVFYGIKSDNAADEHPSVTKEKILEVLKRNMQV